jgi:hypothetical protein
MRGSEAMDLMRLAYDAATDARAAKSMMQGLVQKARRLGVLEDVATELVKGLGEVVAVEFGASIENAVNANYAPYVSARSLGRGVGAPDKKWKAKYLERLDTSKNGLFAVEGDWYDQRKPTEKADGTLVVLTRNDGAAKVYDLLKRSRGCNYVFRRNDGSTKVIEEVEPLRVGGDWTDIVNSVHTYNRTLLFDGGNGGQNSGVNGGKPAP